jgi:hypothetical protein
MLTKKKRRQGLPVVAEKTGEKRPIRPRQIFEQKEVSFIDAKMTVCHIRFSLNEAWRWVSALKEGKSNHAGKRARNGSSGRNCWTSAA